MIVPAAKVSECSCDLCAQSRKYVEETSTILECKTSRELPRLLCTTEPVRLVPRVLLAS